jgi:hypothetical protein
MRFSYAIIALATLTAAPAIAQTSTPSTATPPTTPEARAGVANANNAAAAQAVQQSNMNAADQARYEEDRAAYIAARRARRQDAAIDATIYDRQQRAYADAMYTWRVQTAACKRGILKACKAPTPNPADYW